MNILIIDDNIEFLRVVRLMLESRLAHAIVGEALGGPEGLQLAVALRPEVVLVDFDMPGMDGYEIVRRVKWGVPTARTVIMSGHDEGPYARRATAAGADGFVAKARLEEELFPLLAAMSAQAGP